MKDIKERKVDKSVKFFDKKHAMKHSIKEASVSTKRRMKDTTFNETEKDERQSAVERVEHIGKKNARDMKHQGKRLIVDRRNKSRNKKQSEVEAEHTSSKVKEKERFKSNRIKGKQGEELHKQLNLRNKKRLSIKKPYQRVNDNQMKTVQSYQNNMRIFHIRKKQKQMQDTTYKTTKKSGNVIVRLFKGIGNITKKAVTNMNTIFALGGSFVVLTVFVLFVGIFASLAGDSTTNSATASIAPEVYEHSELVEKYAKKYKISEYKNLIYAVMMQESGGKGNDPMQSSEGEYNTKYPKKPNGITDIEYSIDAGVHYLADNITLAKVKDASDINNISLALQGYNYGKGYIEWAVVNFNGYTRANATVYSDEKKRELGTIVYGDPEYVPHVLQYYHLGNGNMVMIAQSQVGNVGGKPYWSWYGYESRVEWCACFVSWIANEAGLLDNGSFPKFANCDEGIKWFKEKKQWKEKGSIPEPGYIIFFDWDFDGKSDHVGIVEKVEKNIIHTIEGNSINDECKRNSYKIGSNYIVGYGTSQ